MRGILRILHYPEVKVVINILNFAVFLMAIGLAAYALVDKICTLYIVFSIAGLLFLTAIYFFIVLYRQRSKTKRYIRQIEDFLLEGRILKWELSSVHKITQWTDEMQNKVPQWKASVQQWLDENLPEYAAEFDLEGRLTTEFSYAIRYAARAAEHLEGRMQILNEIRREMRYCAI